MSLEKFINTITASLILQFQICPNNIFLSFDALYEAETPLTYRPEASFPVQT